MSNKNHEVCTLLGISTLRVSENGILHASLIRNGLSLTRYSTNCMLATSLHQQKNKYHEKNYYNTNFRNYLF